MTKIGGVRIEDFDKDDQRGRLSAVNRDEGPVEVVLNRGWQLVAWTNEKGRLRIAVNNTHSETVISLTQLGKGSGQKIQTITMTTQEIEYE